MRGIIIILLSWTMLAQPILGLGRLSCDCCTSAAPTDQDAPTATPDAHRCCEVSASVRTRGDEGAPQEPDHRDGPQKCPMSCCVSTPPIGMAPAMEQSVAGSDPVIWVEEISECYTDAPSSRLKRPPRAPALV